MKASTVERRRTETENRILDYLISIANPKTGHVEVSGTQIAKEVGVAATTARVFLAGMVKDGILSQISNIKRGQLTAYKINDMTRGDVVTKYENVFLPNDDEVFEEAGEKLPDLAVPPTPEEEKPYIQVGAEMQQKYEEWKREVAVDNAIKEAEAARIISPSAIAKDVLRQTDYLTVRVFEEFLRIRRALEELVKEVERGNKG